MERGEDLRVVRAEALRACRACLSADNRYGPVTAAHPFLLSQVKLEFHFAVENRVNTRRNHRALKKKKEKEIKKRGWKEKKRKKERIKKGKKIRKEEEEEDEEEGEYEEEEGEETRRGQMGEETEKQTPR